jgi:hypothetical protein
VRRVSGYGLKAYGCDQLHFTAFHFKFGVWFRILARGKYFGSTQLGFLSVGLTLHPFMALGDTCLRAARVGRVG